MFKKKHAPSKSDTTDSSGIGRKEKFVASFGGDDFEDDGADSEEDRFNRRAMSSSSQLRRRFDLGSGVTRSMDLHEGIAEEEGADVTENKVGSSDDDLARTAPPIYSASYSGDSGVPLKRIGSLFGRKSNPGLRDSASTATSPLNPSSAVSSPTAVSNSKSLPTSPRNLHSSQLDSSSSSGDGKISKTVRPRGRMSLAATTSHKSDVSGYATLRRGKQRPESVFGAGTLKFSSKILQAIGFDDGSDSSEVSFGVDDSDDMAGDEDSMDATDFDSLEFAAKFFPVQLYINDEKTSSTYRLKPRESVQNVIRAMIDEHVILRQPEADDQPDSWRLFKVDRSHLATRVQLDPTLTAYAQKIRQGDELRLFNIKVPQSFKYCVPPDKTEHTVSFSYTDTVGDVILSLLGKHQLPTAEKHGMYFKKMGMWLEERKAFVSYELSPNDVLELRVLSQEFLLRIFLPEKDSRITLKVIPSLTVKDVKSMMQYSLKSKKMTLDIRGYADLYMPPSVRSEALEEARKYRKATTFGLFEAGSGRWFADDKSLDEVGIGSMASIGSKVIQYKVQFEPITIALPESMQILNGDYLSSYTIEGNLMSQHAVQTLVADKVTVQDLVETISLSSTDPSRFQSRCGLFSRGGEQLKDSDLVWNVIQNSSPLEVFEYRTVPSKYSFSTTLDPGVLIQVSVNPSEPISESLDNVCRRFGIDPAREFRSLWAGDSVLKVDVNSAPEDIEVGSDGFIRIDAVMVDGYPDSSIWNDVEDSRANITFSESDRGIVTAASFNKLVEKLTSSDSNNDSSNYMEFFQTFLLTYKSFTTPTDFLNKLKERYHVPRMKDRYPSFSDYESSRLRIQLRIINVLQTWTKKYAFDFIDFQGTLKMSDDIQANKKIEAAKNAQLLAKHKLLLEVLLFAEKIIVYDHPGPARQIRKNVLKLRDGTFSFRKEKYQSGIWPAPKFIKPNDGHPVNIFALDSEEIARQLTIVEFDLFSKIMPYEFLNQAWTKKDAVTRAPNIIAVTKKFNEVALWVAKSILEVKAVKNRAKRFSKLVDIAGHLYVLNNFSTLMAFLAGLNKAAVSRLKWTAKEMSTKSVRKFAELESIMSAEGSYKNYRGKIRNINPPAIPYVGVYLLDLTYMEDGNPDQIDGLINFAKRRLIHNLIREVNSFQDTPYLLKPVEEMVEALAGSMRLPVQEENPVSPSGDPSVDNSQPFVTIKTYEDHLFELSLKREPRGAERSAIH